MPGTKEHLCRLHILDEGIILLWSPPLTTTRAIDSDIHARTCTSASSGPAHTQSLSVHGKASEKVHEERMGAGGQGGVWVWSREKMKVPPGPVWRPTKVSSSR